MPVAAATNDDDAQPDSGRYRFTGSSAVKLSGN
jgi:hypothetical protein